METYRRFLAGGDAAEEIAHQAAPLEGIALAAAETAIEESIGQRVGLERDMQAALRRAIEQLEAGLVIVDGGAERSVESGRIDITARDSDGATVVIELKAGAAWQAAVAQILTYMGDVVLEEPDAVVRGILVASTFYKKAVAAARMAPSLSLKAYSVKFQFADASV